MVKKTKELTELLQRVQADFENYKKRVEEEKKQFAKIACKDIIGEILPAIDNLELAIKNKDNKEEFIKAVELIYSELIELLKKNGIKPIKSLNEKFNPELHEALMAEESKKGKDMILEEFQKGYMIGEKVLRHSKVKVSKGGKK